MLFWRRVVGDFKLFSVRRDDQLLGFLSLGLLSLVFLKGEYRDGRFAPSSGFLPDRQISQWVVMEQRLVVSCLLREKWHMGLLCWFDLLLK